MSSVNSSKEVVQAVASTPALVETTAMVPTTTTINTTTISFHDLPGSLLNLHEVCITDWDDIYDGRKLTPREYTSWNGLNITRVSLCAWVIMSHVALILFIIGKRGLRVNPKNPLIASLAAANVLLGVFVVPIKQHFVLNPDTVNCDLEVGWTFIADYYQPSVSLFAVASLVMERFIYVYTVKNQKKVLRLALIAFTLFLLVAPWIASLLFLLPTYLGAFNGESTIPDTCLFKVNDDYFMAAQILSFILPSLCVFLLAPYTGLLDFLRPSHCVYETLTPKGESMTVTALISLLSIFCEVPYCITKVLMTKMECNNHYCARFYQVLNITMWVRIAKAAVFPFIWLLYTDIRRAVLCHLPKRKRESEDDDDMAMLEELGEGGTKRLYPEPVPSTSAAKD